MQLLDQNQIKRKIKRLAFEILENNFDATHLLLAGINNNGMGFAKMLLQQLKQLSEIELELTSIKLNPAAPLEQDITIGQSPEELKDKTIIIVDDVANTGRTIFYAFKPLMEVLPKKIEVAVLVDRKHKAFPIEVNYFGMTLHTTLKDNIKVDIVNRKSQSVFLE